MFFMNFMCCFSSHPVTGQVSLHFTLPLAQQLQCLLLSLLIVDVLKSCTVIRSSLVRQIQKQVQFVCLPCTSLYRESA
jgi:hypothetical protein